MLFVPVEWTKVTAWHMELLRLNSGGNQAAIVTFNPEALKSDKATIGIPGQKQYTLGKPHRTMGDPNGHKAMAVWKNAGEPGYAHISYDYKGKRVWHGIYRVPDEVVLEIIWRDEDCLIIVERNNR